MQLFNGNRAFILLTVLSLNAVGPLLATCGLLLLVIAQAIRSRS